MFDIGSCGGGKYRKSYKTDKQQHAAHQDFPRNRR
jgi:hypothetical protein